MVILTPAGHDPRAVQALADGAEHDLNEVGSRIWELCDGARSVSEIAALIEEEFEVDTATALADCVDFVQGLLAQKLLLEEPK